MPIRTFNDQYSTNFKDSQAALREEEALMVSLQESHPLSREEARYLAWLQRPRSDDHCDPTPDQHDPYGIEDLLSDLEIHDLTGAESSDVIESLTAGEMEVVAGVDEVTAPETDIPVKPKSPSGFTGMSKPADDFDIPVKENRYVSVFRDARTMRQIRTLHDSPEFSGDTTLLVSKALFSLPSKHPSRQTNFKPWWHDSWHPRLPSPARQYRTPAPWRDTSDHLRVTLRHVALKTFGPVFTINLDLSDKVEALARAQAYPLGWLQKRISHHLKQALGRPVQFHLVLEEAGSGHRLHLHGEIQMAFPERRKVRLALRKAGGEWDSEAPQRQLRMRPEPNMGWANYIVGDLWRVGFTRKVLPARGITCSGPAPQSVITFPGEPTCSTDLLDKKAKEIYEAHRELILLAGKK
jgi:hypothetical protein